MGTLLPASILILLAASFVFGGNAIEIPFSGEALMPEIGLGTLPFLASVLVLFPVWSWLAFMHEKLRTPSGLTHWQCSGQHS